MNSELSAILNTYTLPMQIENALFFECFGEDIVQNGRFRILQIADSFCFYRDITDIRIQSIRDILISSILHDPF